MIWYFRTTQKQIQLNNQQNPWMKRVKIYISVELIYFFVDTEANNATDNTTTTTPPPPKMITIREPLEFSVELLDYPDPTIEARANSIKK
jgi:hypothetical protein